VKKLFLLCAVILSLGLLISSCSLPSGETQSLDSTMVAIAIQQTGLALEQAQADQAALSQATPEAVLQPTYTPYPTFTSEAVQGPTMQVLQPAQESQVTEEPVPAESFDDWLKGVNILIYDDMWPMGEPPVVQNAIDSLGLGRNTTNVNDAMGHFLTNLNSATKWDLIIIAAESRSKISGEYFEHLATQLDRGASVVIEVWYIDQVFHGKIQPVMQRCGITFHQDWWRNPNQNLNEFLVYLLEPDHDIFSQPNTISMLSPYDVLWVLDVGDTVKLVPGSDAILLAGTQPKVFNSYGLITECLDGRMIWQTFSTHDYKTQDMISLWMNYIHNALQARYEYLQ